MVLAKKAKFVPLKKLTDFNLASPPGKGKQWMNWIHIEDLANMYVAIKIQYNGSYNAVADETITNETFMKSMAQKIKKFFLAYFLFQIYDETDYGRMSSIILEGKQSVKRENKINRIYF